MKVKKYPHFGFIIDAIDLMPRTHKPRWVKVLDAVTAFVIVWAWAWVIYIIWAWQRK